MDKKEGKKDSRYQMDSRGIKKEETKAKKK